MILVPVDQYKRIINSYDKTTEGLIGELMQMSEEEFDLFLDCIDCKTNKKLTKFAIWICNNRNRTIS